MVSLVEKSPADTLFFASEGPVIAKQLQRRAAAGELIRVAPGIYTLNGDPAEVEGRIRRNWQVLAGKLAPGAVVSHISEFKGGITEEGYVTLSHPTRFNKTLKFPGLQLVLLQGPSQLPGDMRLGSTGLFWASRPRALLENLGRVVKKRPTRAGREAVEEKLVAILNAIKEAGLNRLRDAARELAPQLGAEAEFTALDKMIGALLGTHARGELRTRIGHLVASGTPVDTGCMARLEILASALRSSVLPAIPDVASSGDAKIHFALLESYFSNYVEGTKFSIEEAEGIVLRNKVVESRPKDSHDILGVFHQAITAGTRDTVPPPGTPFPEGLQQRHREMLALRPEVHPGEIKSEPNFAGTTRFVDPAYVRGTLQEGSAMALSVPEGLARAIFYAFFVADVHPFEDGNGRLSRLTMNAELSRLGLCRIVIPTLFHPQYVDCQKALTQGNEPAGLISALAKAAVWCAQFEYSNFKTLIATARNTNAFEESPMQFRLLNIDGSKMA
ncbi:MAG: Fic family protein [Pseudomonadota bacterium]|nr:Fic family protein [Pseudomonadota bacterium]